MDLHRRLRKGSYRGDQMDFVYIDEVQDLTMRQAALFKYICQNFGEGFVFSGDTAQTIARGIEFRFQDIRSFFHNEFISEPESDFEGRAKEKAHCSLSDYFQLNQNFRTHAGILKLSQSVIELLYHFVPLSIDSLSPENSLVYGEAPVLLESVNGKNAIGTIFGNSGSTGGSLIGFGAEQVILVRDDSVKKEVSGQIGKQALVLTLVECKGLEFQDVLLYNFFGTSPLKNQWRVIYGCMGELDLFHCNEHESFPSFCLSKHKILCSELKQLYVALTRARQRLWIYDNIDKFSKPIFDYWKKLGVVQVRHLDESLAQTMQVGSSKEEWCSRGIKLFNEGNFEMATLCFERAGDSYKEKWAKAAGLRAAANRMDGSNSELARVSLTEAAEIFETIGKFGIAAKCFIQLKKYKRAGLLYLNNYEESKLRDAADCFSLAECWSIAAEVYYRANCVLKCLTVCTKGNLFEAGLQFIEKWQADKASDCDAAEIQVLKELKQEFLERCASHYHQIEDTKSMMKFVRSFNSLDLMRIFLETRSYLEELVVLEVEFGNCLEAANSAKLRGDLLLEAEILENGGYYEEASGTLLLYVLVNSLWTTGSKGWPLKKFSNKEKLLKKSKLIAKTRMITFTS
ncbi:TPR and ankyrin repeat-containing protein 1-like [Papaver somniferum]|uniref:TPR and ankyrin repeat-containing protein 1-like n=1 Tax=Papaver somniferum TaxID=3469 RepID=UPI000E70543C|nr:TPR and ankyrin repeat-containing protein 1-like [Papaver somniferum]